VTEFFTDVTGPIPYLGPDSDEALSFRWYDKDRLVAGKRMEDHLRFAVCYWHSFNWDGFDIFGAGTLDRPWLNPALDPSLDPSFDPMAAAEMKQDAAFEFLAKLGVPFFCFHDVDMAPAGSSFTESTANLNAMVDRAAGLMERTGVALLWGTANVFSHPRFAAGAATNPDPELFSRAGAQVCNILEATHRLGGANYVLWGGREGYETLLNTDLSREADQLARFMHLVVEHKHRIGFEGTILIEPKPFEPTKHQYDYDTASVYAFLQRYDLAREIKVNIEVNHATLAGHDFHHEVAYANAAGIFGSIDANAGDDRLGWDVDRFPVSVEQMTLGMYEILRGGGFSTGGLNFDAKLRRQSMARTDLFHAHIGGMDTMARALLAASALLESGELEANRSARYAAWNGQLGQDILNGSLDLPALQKRAFDAPDPQAVSGGQEALENLVARYIERAR
jgi:xylose isomerase